MVDVTLLGTSALLPLPDRPLTAAVIACAGRRILLDCGEGTQSAARAARVGMMHTDLIALTHYHGDHVFGLPGLIQTMGVMGRTDPLYIAGPQDDAGVLTHILALAGNPGFDVRVIPVPQTGIVLRELHPAWPAGAHLLAFPTNHRVSSQGYRFELTRTGRFNPDRARALGVPMLLWNRLVHGETVAFDGQTVAPDQVLGRPRRPLSVAFSGDTALCDALVDGARDADLLICEATYPGDEYADAAAQHGHMTFAQAAQTARAAGVRMLWLAHHSQIITDPQAALPIAQAIFPGASCPNPGAQITLKFDSETDGDRNA